MKITRDTLQQYFAQPLPSIGEIADAFTFHAFEIDSIEGDVLDVKVLPNRAADCNSELGLARELGAILNMPVKDDTARPAGKTVSVSLARINRTLGSNFTAAEVLDVMRRLGIGAQENNGEFTLTVPQDRPDLEIAEDIAEEVGQILGYERVEAVELPPAKEPVNLDRFRGIERMKDMLVEAGYIEVLTQSFAKEGDVYLANPMDKTKPALRTSLEKNLVDALERAKQYAALVLPPNAKPKLFEVGTVFPKSGEYVELRMTEPVKEWGTPAFDNLSVAKLDEYGKGYEPKKYTLGAYKPFSVYPFIQRDVACWTPEGTKVEDVKKIMIEAIPTSKAIQIWDTVTGLQSAPVQHVKGGPIIYKGPMLFDEFTKNGKTSLAFRFIFQTFERTLTDEEVNALMTQVSTALTQKGFEIR